MSKKETTATLPEGITQEMVDAAKTKHGDGNVVIAGLPLDEGGTKTLEVLMARPDKQLISTSEKFEDSDPARSKDILLNSTLLSHRDKVLADDYLKQEAYKAATQLMPIRSAEILSLPGNGIDMPDGVTDKMVADAVLMNRADNVRLAKVYLSDDDSEYVKVLMRRPGASTISEYEKLQNSNPGKAKEKLINGTLLSHRHMVDNDWFFYGAFSAAVKLMSSAKATIKKL